MDNCIFCKIIKGEIPCAKLYEDEKTLSFLDIRPVNPGHALVILKEHHESFLALDPECLKALILTVHKVATAVQKAIGPQGFNLGQNNGQAAGQVVPHVHFHIMPRHVGDGYELWPGREYGSGQMEEAARKIQAAL